MDGVNTLYLLHDILPDQHHHDRHHRKVGHKRGCVRVVSVDLRLSLPHQHYHHHRTVGVGMKVGICVTIRETIKLGWRVRGGRLCE